VGEQPRFIFATCQIGAEAALKAELAARWPEFRFAFSRPGFLTFKLPEDHTLEPGFDLHSVFARSFGFSLGGMRGDRERLIADFWQLAGKLPFCRIHVWQRDQHPPGEFDYEPALTELAREVHAALVRSCPRVLAPHAQRLDQPAERGELVLDCILVEPDYWWVGYHRVHDELSRWPGGLLAVELPADAVSRAWLKMEQALRWSCDGRNCPSLSARGWPSWAARPGAPRSVFFREAIRSWESIRPRWTRALLPIPTSLIFGGVRAMCGGASFARCAGWWPI